MRWRPLMRRDLSREPRRQPPLHKGRNNAAARLGLLAAEWPSGHDDMPSHEWHASRISAVSVGAQPARLQSPCVGLLLLLCSLSAHTFLGICHAWSQARGVVAWLSAALPTRLEASSTCILDDRDPAICLEPTRRPCRSCVTFFAALEAAPGGQKKFRLFDTPGMRIYISS